MCVWLFAKRRSALCEPSFYTQVLDDEDKKERQWGIDAGLIWGDAAKLTVVYTDLGISTGMKYGIENAKNAGRPIEYRKLHADIFSDYLAKKFQS